MNNSKNSILNGFKNHRNVTPFQEVIKGVYDADRIDHSKFDIFSSKQIKCYLNNIILENKGVSKEIQKSIVDNTNAEFSKLIPITLKKGGKPAQFFMAAKGSCKEILKAFEPVNEKEDYFKDDDFDEEEVLEYIKDNDADDDSLINEFGDGIIDYLNKLHEEGKIDVDEDKGVYKVTESDKDSDKEENEEDDEDADLDEKKKKKENDEDADEDDKKEEAKKKKERKKDDEDADIDDKREKRKKKREKEEDDRDADLDDKREERKKKREKDIDDKDADIDDKEKEDDEDRERALDDIDADLDDKKKEKDELEGEGSDISSEGMGLKGTPIGEDEESYDDKEKEDDEDKRSIFDDDDDDDEDEELKDEKDELKDNADDGENIFENKENEEVDNENEEDNNLDGEDEEDEKINHNDDSEEEYSPEELEKMAKQTATTTLIKFYKNSNDEDKKDIVKLELKIRGIDVDEISGGDKEGKDDKDLPESKEELKRLDGWMHQMFNDYDREDLRDYVSGLVLQSPAKRKELKEHYRDYYKMNNAGNSLAKVDNEEFKTWLTDTYLKNFSDGDLQQYALSLVSKNPIEYNKLRKTYKSFEENGML